MRQNLGKLDRTFRFVLALWILGPWAPYFHQAWLGWLVTIIGIIALIESFVGFCPAHNWFGIDNKHQ